MSGFSDPSKCHELLGYMDVRCNRPKGHDGGHVGPFYIPSAITPPAVVSESDTGAGEDCPHDSESGIDQTSAADPDKVWRCDGCGRQMSGAGEWR